jgi:hypothetical protein
MPKPRLRAKRRIELSDAHIRDLLDGPRPWGPWSNPWNYNNSPDETETILADMRAAWESLRDDLLPNWIEDHPGTRLWAWWQFDAPESRRLMSGPGASAINDPTALPWSKRLEFGKPVVFRTEDELRSVWEPEADYLERLGLMTEHEVLLNEGIEL